MEEENKDRKKLSYSPGIIIGIIFLILAAAAAMFFLICFVFKVLEPGRVVCAPDAKPCADGSYVGRVPPLCGFARCPAFFTRKADENNAPPDGCLTGKSYPDQESCVCEGEWIEVDVQVPARDGFEWETWVACSVTPRAEDWREYENARYGYSFRYPEVMGVMKLRLYDSPAERVRLSAGQGMITFEVSETAATGTVDDFLCSRFAADDCAGFLVGERAGSGSPVGAYYEGEQEISDGLTARTVRQNTRGEKLIHFFVDLPESNILEIKVSTTFFPEHKKILQTLDLKKQ